MKRPPAEALPPPPRPTILDRIPDTFPVQPIVPGTPESIGVDLTTCGSCGLSWNDDVSTDLTPVPSGRCPFEYFHDEPIDTRPILDLTYTSGRLCIGVTELDNQGYGVRAYTLATQEPHTVAEVMVRRFDDMARLMGENVQIRRDYWTDEHDAADEADARNADDNFDTQAWQTAYVNTSDGGFWTVTLVNVED